MLTFNCFISRLALVQWIRYPNRNLSLGSVTCEQLSLLFLLLMEKIQKDTWIRQILCKSKQWPLRLSLVSFFGWGEGWGERDGREGSGKMSWPCHPLCLLISVSVLLFPTNNSAAHLTHSFITKISHFSMNPSHFWIFPFSLSPFPRLPIFLFLGFLVSPFPLSHNFHHFVIPFLSSLLSIFHFTISCVNVLQDSVPFLLSPQNFYVPMSLFIHFFTFPFHRSYVFPAYFAPGPVAEWKSEGGLGPPRSDANLPRFLSFFEIFRNYHTVFNHASFCMVNAWNRLIPINRRNKGNKWSRDQVPGITKYGKKKQTCYFFQSFFFSVFFLSFLFLF